MFWIVVYTLIMSTSMAAIIIFFNPTLGLFVQYSLNVRNIVCTPVRQEIVNLICIRFIPDAVTCTQRRSDAQTLSKHDVKTNLPFCFTLFLIKTYPIVLIGVFV